MQPLWSCFSCGMSLISMFKTSKRLQPAADEPWHVTVFYTPCQSLYTLSIIIHLVNHYTPCHSARHNHHSQNSVKTINIKPLRHFWTKSLVISFFAWPLLPVGQFRLEMACSFNKLTTASYVLCNINKKTYGPEEIVIEFIPSVDYFCCCCCCCCCCCYCCCCCCWSLGI